MTSLAGTIAPAPQAVKDAHRAVWALGDYPTVAADIVAPLGPVLVGAAGVSAGDVMLDIAAGSGTVAVPAAQVGATVTASDLTPELLDEGRRRAGPEAGNLTWEVADAEQLHYSDAAFDVVVSCVGIMFAPIHAAAANELARVCRPGGRIGLINWTPDGFIGQMFAAMKPFAPPPPPGALPPPLWGDEGHLHGLLGDQVDDFDLRRQHLRVTRFESAVAFREYFKARYGPTIAVYRSLADDPERTAALDDALVELAKTFDLGGGTMEWEYLLATGRRR